MAHEESDAKETGARPEAGSGKRASFRSRLAKVRLVQWGGRYARLVTDRSRSRWRQGFYLVAGAAGAGMAVLMLLLLYALVLLPFTPSVDALKRAKVERPAIILSTEGQELTRFRRLNREWVELDEIAPGVKEALVATEDHRFYTHRGIDVRRLVSALAHTLVGDVQGGSTITQQLARNLYPESIGRSVTVTRKLKEIITALKIESAYTKEEILETYLNTVPFLYNVYGIELAARTYFSKSAEDLSVIDAATLVGMLKGTSYYNPVRNPERAQRRRNVVLGQMVKHGMLAGEEYARLKDLPVVLRFERQAQQASKAPHFTQYVRDWLTRWADDHGYDIYADGLVVHTTLDLDLQRVAEAVVKLQGERLQAVADVEWGRASAAPPSVSLASYPRYRERIEPFGRFWTARPDLAEAFIRETAAFKQGRASGRDDASLLDSLRGERRFMDSLRTVKTRLEASFVAIDPQSGHVRAWVGSRDFAQSAFDRVARSRRQPGSTFKPFVYAQALEEGYEPGDLFWDREVEIPLEGDRVWRPRNASEVSGEQVTLRDGLVHSMNTVTAQLIHEVGAGDVAARAERMGVNRSKLRKVPSLALGTSEVTLLEMVSAYATIAALGTYRQPVYVTRIEDRDGNVLATFSPTPRKALSEETARHLVDMMRGVVDEGTGNGIRRAFGIDADVAGKTGTTQDGADGWFILMHPTLVSGAWVGFDDPRVTFRSDYWGQGAHNALYVVGEFSRRIFNGRYVDTRAVFPAPPSAEEDAAPLLARVGGWLRGILEGSGAEIREEEDRSVDAERNQRSDRRRRHSRARERDREREREARAEVLERAREQREELEELARELHERLRGRSRERSLDEVEREMERVRREIEREVARELERWQEEVERAERGRGW